MDVRSNADPSAADRGTTFILKVPVAAGSGNEGRKMAASAARNEPGSGVAGMQVFGTKGKENG